jgi:hypothetical protein
VMVGTGGGHCAVSMRVLCDEGLSFEQGEPVPPIVDVHDKYFHVVHIQAHFAGLRLGWIVGATYRDCWMIVEYTGDYTTISVGIPISASLLPWRLRPRPTC